MLPGDSVLCFDGRFAASRRYLLWPVVRYRVTAPLLRVRRIDIFEKVILALTAAGVRDAARIAGRIHQDEQLCLHILTQLREAGHLDDRNAPTASGHTTLNTGQLSETPELIVTHVFQDPFTGDLWPRAETDLRYRQVDRLREQTAAIRLGSRGAGEDVDAVVVSAPGRPPRPTPAQVIGAIAAHRLADARRRRQMFEAVPATDAHPDDADADALRTVAGQIRTAPDVHRVAELGEPVDEYLLASIEAGDGRWNANDPFGSGGSPLFEHFVLVRGHEDVRVRELVTVTAEDAAGTLRRRESALAQESRLRIEDGIARSLAVDLARYPETVSLLIGMEEAASRAPDPAAIEAVARESFRLWEHLLRRLATEYPPPVPWAGSPTKNSQNRQSKQDKQARRLLTETIGNYIEDLGLDRANRGPVNGPPRTNPAAPERPNLSKAMYGECLCWAIIAAADPNSRWRAEHPLRELARGRPTLLADLRALGDTRNRGSHADRDASWEEDVEWCRQFAFEAARVLVVLSPEIHERPTD